MSTEVPVLSGQFEFHGVYQLDGVYFYNLYNKRESRGNWMRDNQVEEGFPRIIRFNPDKDVLTVEVAGETVVLELVDTTDNPMPLSPGATPQPAVRPATTTSSTRTAPPRRRVIRPTSRTTDSASARRPVIRPSTEQ